MNAKTLHTKFGPLANCLLQDLPTFSYDVVRLVIQYAQCGRPERGGSLRLLCAVRVGCVGEKTLHWRAPGELLVMGKSEACSGRMIVCCADSLQPVSSERLPFKEILSTALDIHGNHYYLVRNSELEVLNTSGRRVLVVERHVCWSTFSLFVHSMCIDQRCRVWTTHGTNQVHLYMSPGAYRGCDLLNPSSDAKGPDKWVHGCWDVPLASCLTVDRVRERVYVAGGSYVRCFDTFGVVRRRETLDVNLHNRTNLTRRRRRKSHDDGKVPKLDSVACDAFGFVYACDSRNKAIHVLDNNLRLVGCWNVDAEFAQTEDAPVAICVDPFNRVYIATLKGQLLSFTFDA